MPQPCGVCTTTEAKYRCPTCRILYCSLACSKTHNETPCAPLPAPEKPRESTVTSAPSISMDEKRERLTEEQMGTLETCASVKKWLANPAITTALTQIECSQDKTKALEKALLDPPFAEFMYHALDQVVTLK
uniref:HIT-type domain-containing protein n=1 Tax=Peronospora matthiolae TaxID=2874970 RepID=A0AAV1TR98_9STRA